jgi:predicted DCC family thiol-disulfide oxidoreductase YuxK
MGGPVWLFDATCLLCSGAVRYVLKHEMNPGMRFVAIQSADGRKLAMQYQIDPDDPLSFLFVDGGTGYTASDGVFQLLTHVSGWARLLRVFRVVPKAVRDPVYYWIARHRYRVFGRSDNCMVPDPAVRDRFHLPVL